MSKYKVLQVLGTTDLGGAESRIMDLYSNIDLEQVQFDFLVHKKGGYYDDKIRALGGHIYVLPRFKVYNILSYRKAIQAFFRDHQGEYQVVHGHMTSTAAIYLPIAKKMGVPVTIAHARSAGVDQGIKGKVTKFLRRNLWKKADYLFTCSDLAAQAVFGRTAIFIPNAIDTTRFVFDQNKREEIRNQIGVAKDTFVCGHIGRFHYAKNHEYLLEIFAQLVKEHPNSLLLLLGDGPGMEAQKELAKTLGIQDKVLFAGNKSNPEHYYHAMDCFVFPSRFEGLPGTVVEAQASGLHCIISDAIAKETQVTDLVEWRSIQEEPKEWAKRVCQLAEVYAKQGEDVYETRHLYAKQVAEQGFDVKVQAKRLLKLYQDYVEKAK